MPYDNPDPVFTLEIFQRKLVSINKFAHCDVALYATITNDSDLNEVDRLIDAGACAFKISSFENHPTRFPRIRNGRVIALMNRIAKTDLPLGLHNEDEDIVRSSLAEFADKGLTDACFHSPSRPEIAELVATVSFLEMGRAPAHVSISFIYPRPGVLILSDATKRMAHAHRGKCAFITSHSMQFMIPRGWGRR
jgi:allantoinase